MVSEQSAGISSPTLTGLSIGSSNPATREHVEAIRRTSLAEVLDLVIPRLSEAQEAGEIPDLPDRMVVIAAGEGNATAAAPCWMPNCIQTVLGSGCIERISSTWAGM